MCMRRLHAMILAVISIVVVAACTTTEPDSQAQLLSLQELTEAPGYAWFPAEMSTFTPRAPYVEQIATNFATNSSKVCIFVRPSCSCTGTQKLFPQIIKSLMAANVDMSKVEIWSMRSTTDAHPYQPGVTISDLPTIWVFRNGVPTTSISDSQYQLSNPNADSLIAAALLQ